MSNDWCVPWKCPCLTCELWLNDSLEPNCACKPCSVKGLRRPQDVWCWKTAETCRAFDNLTSKFIPSRRELSAYGIEFNEFAINIFANREEAEAEIKRREERKQ